MALTPEEQKKLNNLLKEGIELAKKLGLTADEASLKNFTGDLVQAERIVKSLRDEWKDYISDIAGAREGFVRILDEIKGINSGINRSKEAFKGLTSLAAKLQSHADGTNRLSTKELEKLKQQTKQREEDLKLAGKLAKDRVKELEGKATLSKKEKKELTEARIAHQNISQEITKNAGHLKQFNEQLDRNIDVQKQIEKSLGVTGALMKGMSKIPFLGDLPGMSDILGNVEEDIRQIEEKEGRIVSKSEAMKMAFKKMGPTLKEGLTDPLVIGGFLFNEMKAAILGADKATGELAKNTDLTYTEALQAREEFTNIANLSMDSAINTKGLQESYSAIASSLGAQADINQKDLETFTKLREQAGFTNEELAGMYKMSLVTGKSIEQTSEEFLGGAEALAKQKGLSINVKQLMKDSASVSADIKLSLGGSAESLAKAMVSAKALGVNLEKVDDIANSLLQFEDSISSELEAELLTGKDITLERARLAALNNDFATVAEEINNQLGGSAEFSAMNRLQQEAIAKSVGMTREELAKSLTEQEALQKVGVKTAEAAKEKYDALVAQYGVEKAQQMLGDEALARQFKQQDNQEKVNQAIEKARDLFIGLAQPILEFVTPIVDLVTTILPAVNFLLSPLIEGFKLIGNLVSGFVDGLKKGQPIMVAIAAGLTAILAPTIMTAIFSIFSAFAKIPFGVGIPLAITAVAGMISLATKSANDVKKIKDGAIDSNGGLVVSKPEGGIVAQGIKDDNVVFTTNDVKSGGGTSTGGNTSGMMSELVAIKNLLQQIASTPGKVEIDGTEAGRVLAPLINQTNLQTQVKTQ
jgi:hypothetical protein